MNKYKFDFVWNGHEFGHKEVKKSNGITTKYYKDGKEITPAEHTENAEKYAKIFSK